MLFKALLCFLLISALYGALLLLLLSLPLPHLLYWTVWL